MTTSADSTFRFWNLGVPGTARITHNRWKNIYSKDLIHCASHPTDEAFRSVAAHPDRGGVAVGDGGRAASTTPSACPGSPSPSRTP